MMAIDGFCELCRARINVGLDEEPLCDQCLKKLPMAAWKALADDDDRVVVVATHDSRMLPLADQVVEQGSRDQIFEEFGLLPPQVAKRIQMFMRSHKPAMLVAK